MVLLQAFIMFWLVKKVVGGNDQSITSWKSQLEQRARKVSTGKSHRRQRIEVWLSKTACKEGRKHYRECSCGRTVKAFCLSNSLSW